MQMFFKKITKVRRVKNTVYVDCFGGIFAGRNRPSKWRAKGSNAGSHPNMLKAPKRKVIFSSQ